MAHPKKTLKVRCPICKKTFEYYDSKDRPFCSDRCRLIDLGTWLNEGYRVPVDEATEVEDKVPEENDDETEDD